MCWPMLDFLSLAAVGRVVYVGVVLVFRIVPCHGNVPSKITCSS